MKEESLTLASMQSEVDSWIRGTGKGYFSELTNMVLLTEETGELARVVARLYGDQVAKKSDLRDPSHPEESLRADLKEEIADVLWVLTCIANQTGVDLTEVFRQTIEKKTRRDANRFQ